MENLENKTQPRDEHDENLDHDRPNDDNRENWRRKYAFEDVQLVPNAPAAKFVKDLREDQEVVDDCVAVLVHETLSNAAKFVIFFFCLVQQPIRHCSEGISCLRVHHE